MQKAGDKVTKSKVLASLIVAIATTITVIYWPEITVTINNEVNIVFEED